MDDLVRRLSEPDQPVAVGGPRPSLAELRVRLEEIGHVFVTFPGPSGDTDLGVHVDRAATELRDGGFLMGTGTAHIEGELVLDGTRVRCVADIDLATLRGTGRLTPV